jgi:hypothetical protein
MLKNLGQIFYHFLILFVSAGIALSIPTLVGFLARGYLRSWAMIENEKVLLVVVEIAIAAALILFFHDLRRSWTERRLSKTARAAGLFLMNPAKGLISRWNAARMKRQQGRAREIMIIGATGFQTFVNPSGDLHEAVRNCREARIMLLDPRGEGARARALSLPVPEITPERFREQIRASIDFLKGLRSLQKKVRLKLYPDTPLLKLAILGDFLWVRHYHPGLEVRTLPEFLFRHSPEPGGFYDPLHQYFFSRWQDPRIPEYDLETDELVYQTGEGGERREVFLPETDAEAVPQLGLCT